MMVLGFKSPYEDTRVPLPPAFKFEVGPIWPHFGVLIGDVLEPSGTFWPKVRDFARFLGPSGGQAQRRAACKGHRRQRVRDFVRFLERVPIF